MAWKTDDELVGQKVLIFFGYDDDMIATVLAVSDRAGRIKVLADDDGEIYCGNQWEYAE